MGLSEDDRKCGIHLGLSKLRWYAEDEVERMVAAAWDQGYADGFGDGGEMAEPPWAANPYRDEELSEADDAALAAEYDRQRGYDRPLSERSREAHRLAGGAPTIQWSTTLGRNSAGT